MTKARHAQVVVAAALLLLAAAGSASAQYKHVAPDGRVTYSDRPIPGAIARPVAPATTADAGELPYELRRVVQRYPVTLYTTSPCAPCDSARTLLRQRGIPFAELTVQSNEDIAELQRREGSIDMPMLRLGSQRLNGFDSTDWQATLDAAGYPRTSKLPASYRAAAPRSLVATAAPAASAGSAAGAGGTPVISPASGGFRF